jgi:serine/threonine protein kinase
MADHLPFGRTISLSAARNHNRLCDQFERGWRSGSPPRIEDFLSQVPPDQQPDLFAALFRVELECRPERPAAGEYQARFPQFALLIEALLHDPAADTAGLVPLSGTFTPPSIPGYELFGQIGAGGMGVVYRARHIDLDRSVAIKMIKSGVLCRPEDLLRFHLEARAVAALNHPGVVHLYSFGQVDGLPYYVMEYVDGGSLDDRLNGPPPRPAWSAGLIEKLARTVQYVHDHGIVHRDLKPANVLLGKAVLGKQNADDASDVMPKLADFGLAKRLTGSDPSITRSRAVLGTASYMAPEQAGGKTKEAGKAADIYGLGAILFELLTGRPPFQAESYALTVVQVLTEEPPRPTSLVPGLAADLEAICLKCLEKDPARRYATANELADDLRRWLDGLPTNIGPDQMLDRDARWARRIGYEIKDRLGSSHWAYIYAAVQTTIGRKVMLQLSAGSVGSPQHAALKRQAAVLVGLDHPNIIRLLDYGEQGGQPYLILESIEGGTTLSRFIREGSHASDGLERLPADASRQPLVPRRAAEICLQIALGLQETHQHDILHCGLHTGAIVLTRDGVAKITGFEEAQRYSEPVVGELTPPADAVPPAFVSPELFVGLTNRIGPAVDIYGVGAILYDLLTGRPPFLGATVAETRQRVLHEQPIPPSRFEPSIPMAIEAICLKCLDKAPARRYQKATELQQALQAFLRPHDAPDGETTVGNNDHVSAPSVVSTTRFQLRIIEPKDQAGITFALPRQRFTIGRSKDCDIVLPGQDISRPHCGVSWNEEAGQHELLDFGSKNGSFVNKERVKGSRLLVPGDRIQVPGFEFKFEPVSS